ncbi:MAG TPA: chorismate-binding protein [Acidimicrobiales bacterium]|nr:chorismate-binding protein [Acidimicrobiales bacterium]
MKRSAPRGGDLGPGREKFVELARSHRIVPVWRELMADTVTPVAAFRRVVGEEPGFLLESVEGGERWGRYSFVGRSPIATFVARGSAVELRGGVTSDQITGGNEGILPSLESFLAEFRSPAIAELPLHSGVVGYLGYDVVREIERIGQVPADDLGFPDAVLDVIGQVCAIDHWRQRVVLVDNVLVDGQWSDEESGSAFDAVGERIDQLATDLFSGVEDLPLDFPAADDERPSVTRTMTQKQYGDAVTVGKEHIRQGDIFQVVLSQRFDLELDADPFDFYRVLRVVNPSPYLYFLRSEAATVVGASPEPMVRLRDGVVTSRPIAGTRRRGDNEVEDLRLAAELSEHPKELAEHVMLVDLARNDVGRVVSFGTEVVEELMTVERYSHVMHLTSQVSGQLVPGKGPVDVLRATFPAGTLSGAPKVRAMQIIDDLEPTKRGVYGGVVGYIDLSGNLDTAIAIRTMVVAPDGRASVQAGAGIVADSDPVEEDLECVNKAAALLAAVPAARRMSAARRREEAEIDYAVLKRAVGALRIGRDVVRVSGPDAEEYLQGQCSQDVASMSEGQSADALLLSPQGKLDALVRVTRTSQDSFLLDVDEGFGDAVRARLLKFRLRVKVEIELEPWRCVALRGPGLDGEVNGHDASRAVHAHATGATGASAKGVEFTLGWSWGSLYGLDLIGSAPNAPPGVPWCSRAAWDAIRIEAGIPVMGAELDERTIAAEAGLLERTVSFTKGCYTGQELIARMDARGNRVARYLRGIVVDAGCDVPETGAEVSLEGKVVGAITSSAWSPGLKAPVALAYLHRSAQVPGRVEISGRNGLITAEARSLPLVS